mgnify:FL=1
MNTKLWYLPYFEGGYYTQTIETNYNADARMVRMVHTMDVTYTCLEVFLAFFEMKTIHLLFYIIDRHKLFSIQSTLPCHSHVFCDTLFSFHFFPPKSMQKVQFQTYFLSSIYIFTSHWDMWAITNFLAIIEE